MTSQQGANTHFERTFLPTVELAHSDKSTVKLFRIEVRNTIFKINYAPPQKKTTSFVSDKDINDNFYIKNGNHVFKSAEPHC